MNNEYYNINIKYSTYITMVILMIHNMKLFLYHKYDYIYIYIYIYICTPYIILALYRYFIKKRGIDDFVYFWVWWIKDLSVILIIESNIFFDILLIYPIIPVLVSFMTIEIMEAS